MALLPLPNVAAQITADGKLQLVLTGAPSAGTMTVTLAKNVTQPTLGHPVTLDLSDLVQLVFDHNLRKPPLQKPEHDARMNALGAR